MGGEAERDHEEGGDGVGSEDGWNEGFSIGEDFVDRVSDFSSNTPSARNSTLHILTPASYLFPKDNVSPTTHFVTPSTFLFPKGTVSPTTQVVTPASFLFP